ncbi:hypothetical protein [Bradyrhizobium sp. LA7.1]|uniref:hypothetical protein n=1 Tax=Bradyrhizobium sp. LA7.1 TaxID=3156324 RepID=UPI0033919258
MTPAHVAAERNISDAMVSRDQVVEDIEKEIDETFAASKLVEVGYAQAVWTLLSMNEDAYLKAITTLSDTEMHIFADVRLNALTYPLRVCLNRCKVTSEPIRSELINEDYQVAWEWLKAAEDYSQFCSMFPLWHRERLEISVTADRLTVANPPNTNKQYEAYNRLIRKEARSNPVVGSPNETLLQDIRSRTTIGKDWFRINFNPQLVGRLISFLSTTMSDRQTLPDNWQFSSFSLDEYRKIFLAIQSMLYAWLLVRIELASNGLPGLGYRSSVWVVDKQELIARLRRYTSINESTVGKVLDLLTFGSNQVKSPDIAIQPLIDMKNGFYALSPFVWLNTNMERNLCVLLNQIPDQRKKYSLLSNEKEAATRKEITDLLSPCGYDLRYGQVQGTNIDLAVIDRANKVCLCLELKWFIEPAEIRETEDRTEELAKGISQCKILNRLFEQNDVQMQTVLGISPDYLFFSAVASVNWIGLSEVQALDVPIIKVMHLLDKIREARSLFGAVQWLKGRQYLPEEVRDYTVEPWEISCGRWSATWYGIKPN